MNIEGKQVWLSGTSGTTIKMSFLRIFVSQFEMEKKSVFVCVFGMGWGEIISNLHHAKKNACLMTDASMIHSDSFRCRYRFNLCGLRRAFLSVNLHFIFTLCVPLNYLPKY